MKKIFAVFGALFLIVCLSFSPRAAETGEIERYAGTERLLQSTPDSVPLDQIETYSKPENSGKLFEMIGRWLLSFFSLGVRDGIRGLFGTVATLFCCAVFRALMEKNGAIHPASDLLFLLALSFSVFPDIESAIRAAGETLNLCADFMIAAAPVFLALNSLAGNFTSAVLQSTFLQFVLNLFSGVIAKFLLPLMRGLFAFLLAGNLGENGLAPLGKSLRKGVRNAVVFFFILTSALLTFTNALAVAEDSVLMRSVRFAAGAFIPVVGSSVGDATKTIAASVDCVKTQCGITAFLILLYLLLKPVIAIAIRRLFFTVATAFAGMTGEKKGAAFLEQCKELLGLLSALLIAQGVFFLYYLNLFLQTKSF